MKQEENKKLESPSQEKELLARDEVKTMKKDVSRLRESESNNEMERLSKIKTEEELKNERERIEMAKKAAVERDSIEKQAEQKIQETQRMKQEREAREASLKEEGKQKEQVRGERLSEALKETQLKEERTRQEFLERVKAKAEGRESASVIPPKVAAVIKPTEPGALAVGRINVKQKLWIRIIVFLLMVAILASIATFFYWYFAKRTPAPSKETQETVKQEIIIPLSLIETDSTQTLDSVNPYLLFQVLNQPMDQEALTRVLIKDLEKNEIIKLDSFFNAYSINPPQGFYDRLENDFTLFVYSQEEGNRFGIIVKTKGEMAEIMSSWESTMEQDLENIFVLLGKEDPALSSSFKEADYQSLPFRFQTFSRQDTGIVYSIYNNYLVITTSWKSMEKTLEKLKEAASTVSFSPENRAEFILGNMALEDKVGQLFLMGIEETVFTEETQQLIEKVRPGGVLLLKKNIESAAQVKKLVEDLQQASLNSNGFPLFIAVDQEGGVISPISFIREKTSPSEITNATEAYNIGVERGEELKKLGINLNLAPVLDSTGPDDFLFNRSFQKNEQETSILAKALILGQKEASIITAIKHFPGYGNIDFNPDKKLATLEKTPGFRQFQEVMSAQPELVMVSNAIYSEIDPDLPFALSLKGIGLLKKSLGEEYIIITDALPQDNLTDRFSLKSIVTLPIMAGVDMLIFTGRDETIKTAAQILVEAVKNNEISEKTIDESALKIIKLKQKLL
ncbi:MAG: glycoside hydrolase family 3 N-terminal domain-containing protein [Candidatus Nealsonbacteria bacterium]|nr:glycoside hydrolase family 3 N-terminal domain-containing protein [Candidatus Nealsonbacteria bacterium]